MLPGIDLGQVTHTCVPLSPSSITWYQCKCWGGNGRLWKWCGLPSITLGASPLPAQGHGNRDEHRPWRRIFCICRYTDQCELRYPCWHPTNNVGSSVLHYVLTATILQPFYSPFSGTTRVSQYWKKHSSTHTYPDHQLSFISFLHLLRSIASSLFNFCAWQCFCTTAVQVLVGLPLSKAHMPSVLWRHWLGGRKDI